MSEDPRQLIEAVRAELGPSAVVGEAGDIAPWLTDWRGRFRGASDAILQPATTEEVAAIVRLAARHRVPLVPQGGNTSMVGGATPPPDGSAIILSLRRLKRIRLIDPEANLAVAEAGVILADLHTAAASADRRFPLTLGARGSCTVGGLVATNAGGTQVLKFGTMRSLVLGLEAVLPDGSIHRNLTPLKKDSRGYSLDQLLIGSEGTLGVVTAAALRLVPAAPSRVVAWVALPSPQAALDLLRFLDARLPELEGFEIVPGDTLALVLRHIPGTRAPLHADHPWHVLIEARGEGQVAELQAHFERVLGEALDQGLADDAAIAASEAQAEALWRLRDSISEAERAEGPTLAHDISVAVADMPRFMVDAAETVEQVFPGVSASGFGHLGDGNVHFHVRAPRGAAADWQEREGPRISRLVHDLVTGAGGSISAEHGIGQMKLDEFERLGPPERVAAIRRIKHALDPDGLFNPGKLVR